MDSTNRRKTDRPGHPGGAGLRAALLCVAAAVGFAFASFGGASAAEHDMGLASTDLRPESMSASSSTASPGLSAALLPANELHRNSVDSADPELAIRTAFDQRSGSRGFGRTRGHAPADAWMQSATEPPAVRSPRLSFLLSAVLPGAGQLYNGSRRGYAYLALEAASWFARISYSDAADRKKEDYRAFADRHWDFGRFLGSEDDEGCGFPPGADTLLANYREADLDQYYEELANTADYRCGWNDAVLDPQTNEIVSARRLDYRSQREKSTTYENRAGLALGVIVLNRLVSAVDAFRVARGRQVGESPSLRLTGDIGVDRSSPQAVFRLTKEFP